MTQIEPNPFMRQISARLDSIRMVGIKLQSQQTLLATTTRYSNVETIIGITQSAQYSCAHWNALHAIRMNDLIVSIKYNTEH
jgi:hypothetical protein